MFHGLMFVVRKTVPDPYQECKGVQRQDSTYTPGEIPPSR